MFPPMKQVLHEKFESRKTAQPKLRNLEVLTNDHDKSETQSDMIKELIQEETDDTVLNESTSSQ